MRAQLAAALLALAGARALNVVVAGATGRTGRLVVQNLLTQGHSVTALCRSKANAAERLPPSAALQCVEVDFATSDADAMRAACSGADRLLWCAAGFSEEGELIDVKAMRALPSLFAAGPPAGAAPRVVMLSSAGVTRTQWDEAKKQRLLGAADIPIIRLNPGGILEKKCEAEALLRASGAPYCIVRPTGLKFDGWPRGRPVLSQGDVAVGRTNAMDLADVLVGVLTEPSATGKTFEMFTLAGYPAARSLDAALSRLAPDAAGPPAEAEVEATYRTLQQLLPGEEQDATKLEMGRTYEMVDSGAVAARVPGAAPTEREKQLAASAAAGSEGAGSSPVRSLLKKIFRG